MCSLCLYVRACLCTCVYMPVSARVYVSCTCICENDMSLYMYVQTCDHTLPVFTCVWHVRMSVYMSVRVYGCVHPSRVYVTACIYVHGYISVTRSVCTRVCMQVFMCVHGVCICVHVCTRVSVSVGMCAHVSARVYMRHIRASVCTACLYVCACVYVCAECIYKCPVCICLCA